MPDEESTDVFSTDPQPQVDFGQVMASQLDAFVQQTGRNIHADLQSVGLYAAERSAHLATLVGQPGFEDAVLAERDAVLLKAGVAATNRGDTIDQRLIGLLQGTIRTAAFALLA